MHYSLEPNRSRTQLTAHLIRMAGSALTPFDYKGYWRVAGLLGRMAEQSDLCTVRVGKAGKFRFALNDPYWSRLLQPQFSYEPELAHFFERIKGRQFSIFDCGANLGYWSVFCADVGVDTIFAVEAGPLTFEWLVENSELNGRRFTPLNRAIHERSGKTVHIERRVERNAGAALCNAGAHADPVETISIDDLLSMDTSGKPAVVKLDVEGVEIEALKGAPKAIAGDTVFAYEDHGNDPTCKVTEWILKNTDLMVFFLTHRGNKVPIASTADAKAIKRDVTKGYNFFATRPDSSFT